MFWNAFGVICYYRRPSAFCQREVDQKTSIADRVLWQFRLFCVFVLFYQRIQRIFLKNVNFYIEI